MEPNKPLSASEITKILSDLGGGSKAQGGGGMMQGINNIIRISTQNAIAQTYKQLGILLSNNH